MLLLFVEKGQVIDVGGWKNNYLMLYTFSTLEMEIYF